jgi:hypothetical protein
MLIVVLEQYDKKVVNWVYYPRDARSGRMDPSLRYLEQEFKPAVQYEGDMLVTIARMLLSIVSYGKAWRDAAAGISLNQKNVREFMSDWRRVFKHLGLPSSLPLSKEKDPVDQLLEVLGIEKREVPETVGKKPGEVKRPIIRPVPVLFDAAMVRRGRQFFLHQRILYGPKLMSRVYRAPWNVDENDDDAMDNVSPQCFDSVYHKDDWFLPSRVERSPGFLPSYMYRLPKRMHPLRLRDEPYGSLTLWTNVPESTDCHEIIEEGYPPWRVEQLVKEEIRGRKKRVMEEISESVALWPPSDNVDIGVEFRFSGGYLWKETEENFYVASRNLCVDR